VAQPVENNYFEEKAGKKLSETVRTCRCARIVQDCREKVNRKNTENIQGIAIGRDTSLFLITRFFNQEG
jgi:hypothetical protein